MFDTSNKNVDIRYARKLNNFVLGATCWIQDNFSMAL